MMGIGDRVGKLLVVVSMWSFIAWLDLILFGLGRTHWAGPCGRYLSSCSASYQSQNASLLSALHKSLSLLHLTGTGEKLPLYPAGIGSIVCLYPFRSRRYRVNPRIFVVARLYPILVLPDLNCLRLKLCGVW